MDLEQQYREIHRNRPDYGASAYYTKRVRAFAEKIGAKTVLDFGCGKGAMVRALKPLMGAANVTGYDFAVDEFSDGPAPADLVACIDVIEHFAPGTVRVNLRRICDLAAQAVFFAVSCRPAVEILPNGLNAHLSVHPPEWWVDTIRGVCHSQTGEWIVTLEEVNMANRCAIITATRHRKRRIETVEIFHNDHLPLRGEIAVVGNGPVGPGDRWRINKADHVIRFNDWNRRKGYDPSKTGVRCDTLFTHLDANHDPTGIDKPPKVVVIAIPPPFHIDRVIERADEWYRESDIELFNPYEMRLICRDVLRFDSMGHTHPLPTVGFQMLYHLSNYLPIMDGATAFVTGFTWHVDQSQATAEGLPIESDFMPKHFNHSYLREVKWVAENLLGSKHFEFSEPAWDALEFVRNEVAKGKSCT